MFLVMFFTAPKKINKSCYNIYIFEKIVNSNTRYFTLSWNIACKCKCRKIKFETTLRYKSKVLRKCKKNILVCLSSKTTTFPRNSLKLGPWYIANFRAFFHHHHHWFMIKSNSRDQTNCWKQYNILFSAWGMNTFVTIRVDWMLCSLSSNHPQH